MWIECIISFVFNKSFICLLLFFLILYLYTVRSVLTSYFSTCLKADVIRFSPAVCWTSCCFIWIAKQMIHTQTVIRQWFWVFLSKTIFSIHHQHHHHYRLPDRPARCPDKLEGRWSISMPAEMKQMLTIYSRKISRIENKHILIVIPTQFYRHTFSLLNGSHS